MIQESNTKQQNWWLLAGISFLLLAGGLSVAADTGLLKVKRPHEMMRRFKAQRPGKRKQEGSMKEGGLLWL